MQREYTLLVDDREKIPLLFPEHLVMLDPNHPATRRKTVTVALHVDKATLKTGDYLLSGFRQATIVERKRGLEEIATNCLNPKDRKRFGACLERMYKGARQPVLLMEGTPDVLLKPSRYVEDPWCVIDEFQRLLITFGIQLHLMPTKTQAQRRAAGEWTARMLINGALRYGRDPS